MAYTINVYGSHPQSMSWTTRRFLAALREADAVAPYGRREERPRGARNRMG